MSSILRRIKNIFVSLLYPSGYACVLCDREALLASDGVCDACHSELRLCGVLAAPAPLDALWAAYHYDPVMRTPMHRFKYNGATWLAEFFMQNAPLPNRTVDVVVPVPMHPLKAYFRGYNPPEALALALQQHYPQLVIRTDLLRKTKFTRTQTKLSATQRRKNVENTFLASAEVRGMSVLLIDDVTTTRSTLIACTKALKAQGAAHVYALCACSAGKEEK